MVFTGLDALTRATITLSNAGHNQEQKQVHIPQPLANLKDLQNSSKFILQTPTNYGRLNHTHLNTFPNMREEAMEAAAAAAARVLSGYSGYGLNTNQDIYSAVLGNAARNINHTNKQFLMGTTGMPHINTFLATTTSGMYSPSFLDMTIKTPRSQTPTLAKKRSIDLISEGDLPRAIKVEPKPLFQETKNSKHSSSCCSLMSLSSDDASISSDPTSSKKQKKKRTGKLCTVPGCITRDKGGGLCAKHGGGRPCKADGCSKIVAGVRFCAAHGGKRKKLCSNPGCQKGDQGGGFCASHGGGRRCKVENCPRRDVGRGRCWSHGGGRRCAFYGCQKCPTVDGYCNSHKGVGSLRKN